MKFSVARRDPPESGSDVAGFLSACRQLEEVRTRSHERCRWLTRLEGAERRTAGDLAREEKRSKVNIHGADPDLARRIHEQAAKDLKAQREKIAASAEEMKRLEGQIIAGADLVLMLEQQTKELEARAEKAKTDCELAMLRSLQGSKQGSNWNGDVEESRQALRAVTQELDGVQRAIETASALLKHRAGQKAIAELLPRIEGMVSRQKGALDTAQEINAGIESELERLKEHAINLVRVPEGWPVPDFKAIQGQIATALERLREQAGA